MARPEKRFEQLITEADSTPWGPAEQALLAEAVALAVEIGDEELEYRARMRQTASAYSAGQTDVLLNSFAWCLARHDADPLRFPVDIGNGGADLLWQFKWMAGALRSSPVFSQEQIAAVLDDMEQHYRRAGIGMSGVLMARFEDAWGAGRMEEAERLRVQLAAAPRDDYSHCDACVRSQIAGFYAQTEREEESIVLVEEMIEGGFSCGEEPEHALSRVLVPYLHQGRPEEAPTAHLRSYRLAKDNPENLVIVANNIVFAALTGNEARALAMIERHLPWLTHDPLGVDAHHAALTAFAFGLDRVAAAGHGDTPVRVGDALSRFFGEREDTWTAAALAAAAWREAERIGADFDRRDGTDGHARRVARIRALAEERYEVPIRSNTFAPAPLRNVPADAEGWYERAIALGSYGATDETFDAIAKAEGVEDPERHARLVGLRITTLLAQEGEEGTDAAEALLPEHIALLRAAGQDARARMEERLGLALFGKADDDATAILEQEWADASAHPVPVRGDLALALSAARFDPEAPASALALAEAAETAFAEAGDERRRNAAALTRVMMLLYGGEDPATLLEEVLARPALNDGHRARALETRARMRGGAGAYAEGAGDAEEATRLLTLLGGRGSVAGAHMLAGALWDDAGEPERALSHYRVGVRLIEQSGGDASGAEFRLGRAMLAAGDAAEAVEVLDAVLRREEEREAPAASRALTAGTLARALASSGEYGQAFGAFGYAADLHEQAEEPVDQAMALVEQAKLLAGFDEHADAIEVLERAAALVRPTEAIGALVEVLHQLGQAYGSQQDERAFPLFDEVQRLAAENEAPWLLADVADSRARALAALGRVEEAVAAALGAADGFAELGDAGAAGGSELFAARVLVGAGREADAVPLFRSVIERAAQIPPLRQVAALELGDALERLGRVIEAAEARALAED